MKNVAARIVNSIRDDILSGYLRSGNILKIEYLAARYQASHMPIREALRHLEGEGLIIKEPNRSARVRPVNAELINTMFEVRISMGAMLARQAAMRASARDISQLEQVQMEIERHTAAADLDALVSGNRRFHLAIEAIAGFPEAADVANRQCRLLDSLWRVYGLDSTRIVGVNSDHHYIIRALSNQDPESAAVIMTAHVIKGRMDLIERMRISKPN